MNDKLIIVDGPIKPDMLWSIEHKVGLNFDVRGDSLKIRLRSHGRGRRRHGISDPRRGAFGEL